MEEVIVPTHFQVGVVDASFVPKSGKATYGIDRFYNGKASRPERGLELSMIAVVDVDQAIGYTLSVQQTPPIEAEAEVSPNWTRVDDYLEHLRTTRSDLPGTVRYLVGDGFYSKLKWVNGVVELELEVIGKLRCDANLKYLYDGPQKSRGARRKYDGKVDLSDLRRWEALGEVEDDTELYTAIVWSVSLKRKIRVVYLLNRKHPEQLCYALLFSTDLDLDPIQLYEAYRARFQIEFIFRDAKQFTGLTDCQARDEQKLDFHFNAALTALNIAKAEQYLQRNPWEPFVFSMASYKRRKLNQHLLEAFIHNLDLDETLIKSHPNYSSLCEYGVLVS
ncbi:transposase [Leptothoe spongobia TAU-MAC 1115]|uniref:Transposase n=1 Tax=Leptothoe spongobia TAU-MAC 1115 TaxID=1967444 RepID=A0A947DFN5_9CYAN|nr:transposase [Leptothoe spongobia TAU-MAC 1115]